MQHSFTRCQEAFDRMGADLGVSESHGLLCGMLSARSDFAPEQWLDEVLDVGIGELANVRDAREVLGEESFNVITVGFDTRNDDADAMRHFARNQSVDDPGWYFLSADETTVARLVDELGFTYRPAPHGFDHLTQTTVLDADGVVYRHIYGVDFDPPSIVEPLKEIVFDTPRQAGLLEHWVDTFLLFCTVYDPNSGRYKFDYSIATTIFVGILCLAAIATFIIREWGRAR